jgi:hypothetical protein
MEGILQDRRIRLWELICQQYSIPNHQVSLLDKAIRTGEELPPPKKTKKSKILKAL